MPRPVPAPVPFLVAALALALGCGHGRPPPRAPAAPPQRAANDPLTAIRGQVDALLRDQAEAYWGAWTAGTPADLEATWRGREDLLAPETLARVAAERDRATGEERRALAHLHAFLVGERLAQATRQATGRAADARGSATVAWAGKDVPERQVPALLAGEPDAYRRQLLAQAHAESAARWVPLVEAREEQLARAIRALGYDGTLALAAELRGEVPDALAALAEAVLVRTEEPYRELVTDLAQRQLGLPLERLRARDLPRLFRSRADAKAFPAERQLEQAAGTLRGLGIDLRAQRNVVIDAAARPEKVARPIALPVEVPGSVRVSLAPVEGLEAMRALLHALGAAEYWAHVRSPAVEFRRLGPAAIPETWAQLLEALAADPLWLADRGLEGDALRDEVRTATARRLHAARDAAARVLFEIARAREPARAAERWSALTRRALLHPAEDGEPAGWRTEPDPLLHAAERLRAVLLAAQAERFLSARAGSPAWWRSRRAGEWLRETWAAGSRHTPEELAMAMGARGLDAGALEAIARARAALATATPSH